MDWEEADKVLLHGYIPAFIQYFFSWLVDEAFSSETIVSMPG
jgi:hypothetical protein